MDYSDNMDSKKEQVVFEVKKNPICLLPIWILGILGCWLILIPTIIAIKRTIEYVTTKYTVTNKKIVEKYGWISTQTDEMYLSKIENITVIYSFWGKIFNYGNVIIQGTNRNNINFSNIKNAEEIKNKINALFAV